MSDKDYSKNFGDIDIARVRFDKEEYQPGDTVNADIEIDLSKLHSSCLLYTSPSPRD